jgi:hypothetical protein
MYQINLFQERGEISDTLINSYYAVEILDKLKKEHVL